MRRLKLVIRGKPWAIVLLSPTTFKKRHGNCLAITFSDPKVIYFKRDSLNVSTVRHELFHAYMAESYLGSANLKANQVEEIAAEILAYCLPEFIAQVRIIHKWLNKK
jgi:hypothetical protein